MKAQRYFVLLAAVGIAGVMVTACSKSETTPAAGAGGNTPGGASIVAASSTGTTVPVTAASTGGGAVSNLGLNCAVDADCSGDGNSLTCATSTTDDVVLGGGPAAGYCTKSCKTDTDCPTNGSCLGGTATGPKECLLNCTIGPALTATSVPDPNKCQGRPELRCRELSAATSICLPDCGSDANCDTGRVCDPASGACVDPANVSKGDPTGATCDPNATTPTCAGICVNFVGTDSGACSSPCTLVGNVQTDCGGLANGFCGFAPAEFGIGDSGFCTASCEKQDDCQNPLFFCFDIGAQNGKGYCFGATDCPNGNSDCIDPTTMKPLTETCHETKYGPKCIDPTKFPLGTAGSGGGGGAGATGGAGGAGGSGGGVPTTSLGGAGGTASTGGTGGKASGGAGGSGGK